jgi:predicted acylesterase/phospholipase RssA
MRASFTSFRPALYAASLTALLCIGSCTLLPHGQYRAFPNVAVEQGSSPTPPALERLAVSDQLISGFPGDRSVFIGVAASGGGSRAAVFTAAVMEQLEKLGFMREVRAISSVSGAGLPSAYYAIHGDKLEAGNNKDWDNFHEAMAGDFRSALVAKALNPVNIALTAFTTMDRSDLLADVFDERLFGSTTFGDLAKAPLAPRRPLWFANATDTTAGGRRFVFESETFRKMNSDLKKLKISRAVGASAAFPGLLNSVTLAEFDRTTSTPKSFRHIIDGGTSDNLGIETLLDVAYSFGRAYPSTQAAEPQTAPPFACFLFLVDAFAPYRDKEAAKDPESRRSSLSYFVDLNFLSGFDALLANRRRTQLDILGFPVTQPAPPSYDGLPNRSHLSWFDTSRSVFVEIPPSPSREFGYLRVQNVPLGNLRKDYPQFRPKLDTWESAKITDAQQLSCVVWHISLSGIRSLMQSAGSLDAKGYEGVMGRTAVRWSSHSPVQKYRRAVWDVITQVQTDFDLNGPDKCSKHDVGAAIRAAARIAVLEDPEAGRVACEWFRQTFPNQQFACDPLTPEKYAAGRSDAQGGYSPDPTCGSEPS